MVFPLRQLFAIHNCRNIANQSFKKVRTYKVRTTNYKGLVFNNLKPKHKY